jgi:hypothetical protein
MNNSCDNIGDNIDDDIYQDIINKYIEYYKKTYTDKNIKHMFENIDYDDETSTNHIMESFYSDILNYNNIDNNIYVNGIDFDKNKHTDLYGLKIDDKIICVSFCIISLIIEIINNNYKDWFIIHLK